MVIVWASVRVDEKGSEKASVYIPVRVRSTLD